MQAGDTVVVPVKPWYHSVTIWIQIASIIVAGVGIVIDSAGILDIDSRAVSVLTVTVNILTMIVRTVRTVQPIDGSTTLTTRRLTVTSADGSATG